VRGRCPALEPSGRRRDGRKRWGREYETAKGRSPERGRKPEHGAVGVPSDGRLKGRDLSRQGYRERGEGCRTRAAGANILQGDTDWAGQGGIGGQEGKNMGRVYPWYV
jgi:hypothetical protein